MTAIWTAAIDEDGPVIDLTFAPALSRDGPGRGRVEPFGNPRTVRALIDTGADVTAIHPAALVGLNSFIVRYTSIRRAAGLSPVAPVAHHDLFVSIGDRQVRSGWIRATVAEVEPATPSVLAIIGRDVLQLCTLHYDGPAGEFTLGL